MSVQIAKPSSLPLSHTTTFKRKRSAKMRSSIHPSAKSSSAAAKIATNSSKDNLSRPKDGTTSGHPAVDPVTLKSIPFLLYIWKRSKTDGHIEPQMVVLYWDEEMGSLMPAGSSPTTTTTTSSSSVSTSLSSESLHEKLRIKGNKIPISFHDGIEQFAFAIAYVTKKSVEFIDDLTCCCSIQQIDTNERCLLRNNPVTSQNSATPVAGTENSNSQNTENTATASSSSLSKSDTNRMSLKIQRKATFFMEIEELIVALNDETLRGICKKTRN